MGASEMGHLEKWGAPEQRKNLFGVAFLPLAQPISGKINMDTHAIACVNETNAYSLNGSSFGKVESRLLASLELRT